MFALLNENGLLQLPEVSREAARKLVRRQRGRKPFWIPLEGRRGRVRYDISSPWRQLYQKSTVVQFGLDVRPKRILWPSFATRKARAG